MLRGRVEGKQQGSSVTLPAEALQSLLQMTGASGLLTEVPKLPKGAGASSSSGAPGYRSGRGAGGGGAGVSGTDAGGRGLDAGGHGSGWRGDFGTRGSEAE